jgi:nicotinamide mononucleotide transporter
MLEFLADNWIEVCGALISLIYLVFSIKQKIWLWPFGILSALFYMIIYFQSKFYADMGLQVYYLVISIYGWIIWSPSVRRQDQNDKVLLVSTTDSKLWIVLGMIILSLWGAMYFILANLTDSEIPGWDAFTTAASIVATWMLARKLIEHWLLWIIIDLISMGLYIYKGLYPTAVLFAVYSIMAIVGYRAWRNELKIASR